MKYRKNEAFVDVIETVNLLMSSTGEYLYAVSVYFAGSIETEEMPHLQSSASFCRTLELTYPRSLLSSFRSQEPFSERTLMAKSSCELTSLGPQSASSG